MFKSAEDTVKKSLGLLNIWPLQPPLNGVFTWINPHRWPPNDSLFYCHSFVSEAHKQQKNKPHEDRQANDAKHNR